MSKLGKRFGLISGFAGDIRAKDLEKLERMKGLVVTLDAPDPAAGSRSRHR